MVEALRRKSPRAPSLALDEALDRALRAYDKERLHPAPTEVVAQNIGYKSANNGTALGALASLRYFGLMDRPKEGLLAVTKDVESYKFAPDERLKNSLLIAFLRRPALYGDLLEKYDSGLPSDANLKFELIQRGFAPQAAEATLALFRRSVEFAGYFDRANREVSEDDVPAAQGKEASSDTNESPSMAPTMPPTSTAKLPSGNAAVVEDDLDRIPVRLTGGRRAWLLIPDPFFNADRDRLKAQIDLLLTQEDELDHSAEE